MSTHTCPNCRHTFTEAPKARKGAPGGAPIDLATCTTEELYAYRKRTAPQEDARFFLRSQLQAVHFEYHLETLIETNPPRAEFLRELRQIQVEYFQQYRPAMTIGGARGFVQPVDCAIEYAHAALQAGDDPAFDRLWRNARYYAREALKHYTAPEVPESVPVLVPVQVPVQSVPAEPTIYSCGCEAGACLHTTPEEPAAEFDCGITGCFHPTERDALACWRQTTGETAPVSYEDYYSVD